MLFGFLQAFRQRLCCHAQPPGIASRRYELSKAARFNTRTSTSCLIGNLHFKETAMAGYFLIKRQTIGMLAFLLIATCGGPSALAQYVFVQDTDNAGSWSDPAQWTGGAAGTYPNAVD